MVMTHTLAMDSAVNGMAILDAGGKYIYVNPAYARMIGNTNRKRCSGSPGERFPTTGTWPRSKSEIREALKQHGKWFGPLTMHHSDGTVVPTEMAITTLPDGGTICVSHDITQRVSAQRARAETEIKYRMLVEQVAAISYIAESASMANGCTSAPKSNHFRLHPRRSGSRIRTDGFLTFHPRRPPTINAAEEAAPAAEPFQAEYRFTRKDGKTIWVSDTRSWFRQRQSSRDGRHHRRYHRPQTTRKSIAAGAAGWKPSGGSREASRTISTIF